MQVRLKQVWGSHPAGDLVFVDAKTAVTLVGANVAEYTDLRIYSEPIESISVENNAGLYAYPYNFDFFDVFQGNSYDAVTFSFESFSEFSLIGSSIVMQLREKPGDEIIDEYSTDNLKLTILSEFVFQLPTQIIETKPGSYYYDILIIYSDGRQRTYIGGMWTIYAVITQVQ